MRKPFIAGNWKMNNTPEEAVKLVEQLKPLVADAACDVAICVPFVCLPTVASLVKGTNILLGAQNMHFEEKGAFTGEISPAMLCAVGCDCVIIGHSERRTYFAETDETVNKKVKAALAHGLIPIVCVGETLEEREAGKTDTLVAEQTRLALEGLTAEQAAQVVIAYEPIWAIGTGRTATAQEADRVIGIIRGAVEKAVGAQAAQAMRIQYGGSMNAGNCDELMAQSQIDGGLIGGASLKAADFSRIVHFKA
nr:triose-phosphate isomerase [bacterium]